MSSTAPWLLTEGQREVSHWQSIHPEKANVNRSKPYLKLPFFVHEAQHYSVTISTQFITFYSAHSIIYEVYHFYMWFGTVNHYNEICTHAMLTLYNFPSEDCTILCMPPVVNGEKMVLVLLGGGANPWWPAGNYARNRIIIKNRIYTEKKNIRTRSSPSQRGRIATKGTSLNRPNKQRIPKVDEDAWERDQCLVGRRRCTKHGRSPRW